MSPTSSMARKCSKFYSHLFKTIAEKRDQPYSVIVSWIHKKISFSLIRGIGIFIRGSRSVTSSNDLLILLCVNIIQYCFGLNMNVKISPLQKEMWTFLLEVCDLEEILVNLWLVCKERMHPTGRIKCPEKKLLRKELRKAIYMVS